MGGACEYSHQHDQFKFTLNLYFFIIIIKLEIGVRRRHLFKYIAAITTFTALKPAAALDFVDFEPDIYKKMLKRGKPFMVGFLSDWWPDCRNQQRTVSTLINSNSKYSAITLLHADWDTYRRSTLAKDLNVRRRSTLIMFKDGEEIARNIALTNRDLIEKMFKDAIDQWIILSADR